MSLKGEAYFDVSKDVEHPFVVQTKKCDIKVLGTEFNVRVNEAESDCEFSAALLEGSIELTNKWSLVLPSGLLRCRKRNGREVKWWWNRSVTWMIIVGKRD